jgi:hypothetical protein
MMMLPGQKAYEREWVLGEEVWELIFVKKLGFDGHGECDPETRQMLIKQKQSKEEILKTFFHEVCHGLEFSYDIEIPHDLVYSFEEAWANFFIDNWEAIAKLVMNAKEVR